MKIHFEFLTAGDYDISIGYIKFYNCYSVTNEYSVEIIDNPCVSAGLVVPADTDNGGTRETEYTSTMGQQEDIDFTDFTNGECTYEIEIVSINSETDSTLWPAIYTLT